MEKLRNTIRNFKQESWFPGVNLALLPLEYESGVTTA
jgi:hypothetical protein